MTRSEILECCDCGENFCVTCDDDWRKCPDCGEALCSECQEISLDMRMARCIGCWHEEDLSGRGFHYNPTGRKMFKKYTEPQKGRLNE